MLKVAADLQTAIELFTPVYNRGAPGLQGAISIGVLAPG